MSKRNRALERTWQAAQIKMRHLPTWEHYNKYPTYGEMYSFAKKGKWLPRKYAVVVPSWHIGAVVLQRLGRKRREENYSA